MKSVFLFFFRILSPSDLHQTQIKSKMTTGLSASGEGDTQGDQLGPGGSYPPSGKYNIIFEFLGLFNCLYLTQFLMDFGKILDCKSNDQA